jgi:hypothetical protein
MDLVSAISHEFCWDFRDCSKEDLIRIKMTNQNINLMKAMFDYFDVPEKDIDWVSTNKNSTTKDKVGVT